MSTVYAPSIASEKNALALLVDRDDDTRRMYAQFLKLGTWAIEEASDGREALAKAIARHPDVIVTETRQVLSRAHLRHDTTTPPIQPPILVCPLCDQPLLYKRSHVGGVSARHPEQWDYFECASGCGSFQYRERTRKLRKVL